MIFTAAGILLIVVYYYVKKFLIARNIPHYGPKEADNRVKNGGSVYLDVREDDEWNEDNIPGAYHIPVKQLKKRLSELDRYKGKEIICYCTTGTRSLNAAAFLYKRKYQPANLKGGLIAWKKKDKLP